MNYSSRSSRKGTNSNNTTRLSPTLAKQERLVVHKEGASNDLEIKLLDGNIAFNSSKRPSVVLPLNSNKIESISQTNGPTNIGKENDLTPNKNAAGNRSIHTKGEMSSDTNDGEETGTQQQNINSMTNMNPYFILHVGPPKTATTTIQCGLDKYSEELAQLDNYYYVGKRCPFQKDKTMRNGEAEVPGHFLMMGLRHNSTQNRGYEHLKSRMDYHRRYGHNMIYSLEAFASRLQDADDDIVEVVKNISNKENGDDAVQTKTTSSRQYIWDIFEKLFDGWNVRIVIGYRHYFQWIRSMYYQQHIGPLYQVWPHEKATTRLSKNGGEYHPSYFDYLAYHMRRIERMSKTRSATAITTTTLTNPNQEQRNVSNNLPNEVEMSGKDPSWKAIGVHLSLSTYQLFSRHFDDIVILNLHDHQPSIDPFVNFVCNVLPLHSPPPPTKTSPHQSFSSKNHDDDDENPVGKLCQKLILAMDDSNGHSAAMSNGTKNDNDTHKEINVASPAVDTTTSSSGRSTGPVQLRVSQSFNADFLAEAAYEAFMVDKFLNGTIAPKKLEHVFPATKTTNTTTNPNAKSENKNKNTDQKINKNGNENNFMKVSKKKLVQIIQNEIQRTKLDHDKKFLRCMKQSMQNELLDVSLNFERKLYEVHFRHRQQRRKRREKDNNTNTNGTKKKVINDNEWKGLSQSDIFAHQLLFEEYTAGNDNTNNDMNNKMTKSVGIVCEIDPIKVLSENSHWRTFLKAQIQLLAT